MWSLADLADLPQDQRIEVIGRMAQAGARFSVVCDNDAKADRYSAELQRRYKVRIIERVAGPFEGSVLLRVGPLVN